MPCIAELKGRPLYFGFTGGVSSEPNTLELSQELGLLIGLENDMLVSASVEYSYKKLSALELDPLTVADFEIIEQNSDQIEEQLLNQVGVFHENQMFLLFLGTVTKN